MSDTTIIIIVAVIAVLILSASVAVVIPLRSVRKEKKKTEILMASGVKGEATVLKLEDTGTRIKDNPRVNILLEVRIPGYSPYQVQKTVTIPLVRLSQIQEGSVVAVMADPSHPTNPDKVGILMR